jgi:S1-C subfamily serine protease
MIRCMWGRVLATALLFVPLAGLGGQDTGVLHVRMTLPGSDGVPAPVPRHALLVSDNPVTTSPRVVRTAADGTVDVKLKPGSYTVESERAVMVQGQAYEWFQTVDVPAGGEATLDLNTSNAVVTDPSEHATADTPSGSDPVALLTQWHDSVVSIWSSGGRATGFVVDARGLIATHRAAVGNDTAVAVQLSDTVKVPARVLVADASGDVAVVWVSPDVTTGRRPVPFDCPPPQAPAATADDEFVAMAAELGRPVDVRWGQVTAVRPRTLETDLSLSFGGAGGPVFDDAGAVLGLTAMRVDPQRRWGDVEIIPTAQVCEVVTAARSRMTDATPPEATRLPVEPARPFPAAALEQSTPAPGAGGSPDVVTSADFEIAFITPVAVAQARQKADWTGGRSGRAPELEARIGRLTDFGVLSSYFAGAPAVLVVRVTPRMVEGFWKRVAREAARTPGAELPPFLRFKTSFVRMSLSCGAAAVVPVQPFTLEHRLSETDAIREGLYVFDPNAIGPHCARVTLTLHSEEAPDAPETIVIPTAIVDRLWSEFAIWREALP